jgi:uncharacterized protein
MRCYYEAVRRYLIALALAWTGACIAAFFYSQQQSIPRYIAIAVLPAFLLEIALYLAAGFPDVRKLLDRIKSKVSRAALLTGSAIAPYLLLSLRLGSFRWTSLMVLTAVTAMVAFWYVWMRPFAVVDVLFLALIGGVFISKIFTGVYTRPVPHLPLDILGRLMWIRMGIMAVLSMRRMENLRLGFVPNSGEWRIGIQQFLYFAPVGALAAYLLHIAHFHPIALVWWKIPLYVLGTFLLVLWVLALAEEFFFRGFLQQLLARGLHSEIAGLLAASVVFGMAHISFRHFPNWRFAAIAALAGLFYGVAYMRARSVRACMVTHALVVTTWRVFFPN